MKNVYLEINTKIQQQQKTSTGNPLCTKIVADQKLKIFWVKISDPKESWKDQKQKIMNQTLKETS